MSKSLKLIIILIVFIIVILLTNPLFAYNTINLDDYSINDKVELTRLNTDTIRMLNEDTAIILNSDNQYVNLINPFIFIVNDKYNAKRVDAKFNPIIRKIYNKVTDYSNNNAILSENTDTTCSILINPYQLYIGNNKIYIGGVDSDTMTTVKTSELTQVIVKDISHSTSSGCNSYNNILNLLLFIMAIYFIDTKHREA